METRKKSMICIDRARQSDQTRGLGSLQRAFLWEGQERTREGTKSRRRSRGGFAGIWLHQHEETDRRGTFTRARNGPSDLTAYHHDRRCHGSRRSKGPELLERPRTAAVLLTLPSLPTALFGHATAMYYEESCLGLFEVRLLRRATEYPCLSKERQDRPQTWFPTLAHDPIRPSESLWPTCKHSCPPRAHMLKMLIRLTPWDPPTFSSQPRTINHLTMSITPSRRNSFCFTHFRIRGH